MIYEPNTEIFNRLCDLYGERGLRGVFHALIYYFSHPRRLLTDVQASEQGLVYAIHSSDVQAVDENRAAATVTSREPGEDWHTLTSFVPRKPFLIK